MPRIEKCVCLLCVCFCCCSGRLQKARGFSFQNPKWDERAGTHTCTHFYISNECTHKSRIVKSQIDRLKNVIQTGIIVKMSVAKVWSMLFNSFLLLDLTGLRVMTIMCVCVGCVCVCANVSLDFQHSSFTVNASLFFFGFFSVEL